LFLGLVVASAYGATEKVTPVEKVIKLLEDLKDEVEHEGQEEAKAYDKFACFCKEGNSEKSDGITSGQTDIDETSATLAEKTARMNELTEQIAQLTEDIAKLEKEMAEKEEVRAKEKAKYEAIAADLNRAKAAGEKAIELLEGSKSAASASALLQVKKTLRKYIALADALGLAPKHHRAFQAFLQEADEQDPGVPENDYEFHSQDIITMIEDLVKEFTDKEAQVTAEEEKAADAHSKYMEAATKSLEDYKSEKESKEEEKEEVIGEISEAQEALLDLQAELKDNQRYMKDLTEQCELKAREWDQQTTMRAGELDALSQALKIMETVQEKDVVNERALLLQQSKKAPVAQKEDHDDNISEDELVGDISFLQERVLQKVVAHALAESTDAAARERVVNILKASGVKLGSTMLTSLASQIQADPFKKVKTLIQNLIERLLREAAAEATQKGWCDTELGKARTTRKFQEEKILDLSNQLAKDEAYKAELEEAIETLKEEIEHLNKDLEEATTLRAEDKEMNLQTIKDAGEGLEAVRQAIAVLEEFYKGAAKGAVSLLQESASPVDEDRPEGSRSGAYKGKQTQGSNIIEMLKVIESDFDRTGRRTKEEEEAAHRQFVKFNRETKVSIASKETEQKNKESELEETKLRIEENLNDLKKQQELLDKALQELTALMPACVDTGMDYEERKEKREAEMEALKQACQALMPRDGEPAGNPCDAA